MTSPRYARLFAEALRRYEPRTSDVFLSRSDADEEIELIEQTMSRWQGRASRLRSAVRIAAAAAFLAGAGSAWRLHLAHDRAALTTASAAEPSSPHAETPVVVAIASGDGAVVAALGSSTPAVAGRALTVGSRLIVDPSAGAKLSLSTGTHLDVEPGSQLAVVEDGRTQIFALNAGSLHANVAKLNPNERFLVRTSDAEVEVRGTSFLVTIVPSDPACGGGVTTRVTVSEGIVIVRSRGEEDAVRPGESWPHACHSVSHAPTSLPRIVAKRPFKVATPPAAAPLTLPVLPESAARPAPVLLESPPIRQPPFSTLLEENNLFAEGMLARKNGQLGLALDKMDRLLEKYPASHLAENAGAERMRLLRVIDPARASLAARLYLKLYPTGFAHADAEAILAGSR